MANQVTKKRKTGGPSDFKRVKAKVGKRALKPANETATKFKTASVTIGQQNVAHERVEQQKGDRPVGHDHEEEEEIVELYSTRGRSIEDIVSHLRHPAPAVRISAARGLKDAVSRPEATSNVIRNHLAVLMPVSARCCVDEDADVRQLALAILRDVISKVCSTSNSSSFGSSEAYGNNGHKFIKPFIPLLMAHVTSTLNSLDKKTQLDGTSIVGMLSSAIPSFVASYRAEILPAYVGILSHRSAQVAFSDFRSKSANDSSPSFKNDRKKRGWNRDSSTSGSSSDSSKYQVLHSLLALLKSSKSNRKGKQRGTNDQPDLTIVSGGRGINGVILPGRPANSVPVTPLDTVGELSHFLSVTATNSSKSFGNIQQKILLSQETISDLMGKLRDCFAEASQQEQGRYDHQELLLILECTHLFYNSIAYSVCDGVNNGYDEKVAKGTVPFFKLWSQYSVLVMSLFPLPPSNLVSSNLIVSINLEVCTTTLDVYLNGINGYSIDTEHLDRVLAYLFSELENCKPSYQEEAGATLERSASDDALFDALQRLLAVSRTEQSEENDDQSIAGINHSLINSVAANFFPEPGSEVSAEEIHALATASATRKCVLLARDIFMQCGWSIGRMGEKYESTLIQILRGLVTYMVTWESAHLFESTEVLTLIHNVVRRLDLTGESMSVAESSWMDHIRTSLVPLFRYKKRSKDVVGSVSGSIFESFPGTLQRNILGLVVSLQTPQQGVLDGLSRICARCHGQNNDTVSLETASLIMQSIHSVRRTLSMQAYLGFVANSMGMAQFSSSKASFRDMKEFLRLDASVALTSHILCQCGPSKVLPMLRPLLEQWLSIDQGSGSSDSQAVVARAALSILASCALSLSESGVSVLQIVPDLKTLTTEAICTILQHLPSFEADDEHLCDFLEPLALFFQQESLVFYEIFGKVSSEINKLAISEQTRLVSALLALTNDVRLSAVIRNGKELVSNTRTIENTLFSSSAERLGGRLRASMEVHCGVGAASG